MEHARRATTRRPPAQRAERLERLAEAHVVGEQRAEACVAQEREPGDAALLVGAQLRVQIDRKYRVGQPREALQQLAQAREARGLRLAERSAQARQVGKCARGQLARAAARGQQVRERAPVLPQEVGGKLRKSSAGKCGQGAARTPCGQRGRALDAHAAPVDARREAEPEALGLEREVGASGAARKYPRCAPPRSSTSSASSLGRS